MRREPGAFLGPRRRSAVLAGTSLRLLGLPPALLRWLFVMPTLAHLAQDAFAGELPFNARAAAATSLFWTSMRIQEPFYRRERRFDFSDPL